MIFNHDIKKIVSSGRNFIAFPHLNLNLVMEA